MTVSPALTPEQWERALHPALPADVTGHGDVRWQMMVSPLRAMALGNSMLNDDDPHKLTHEDVKAVNVMLSLAETCMTRHSPIAYPGTFALLVHARGVVAKVAAILPPEQ